jgi:hypothetical protein
MARSTDRTKWIASLDTKDSCVNWVGCYMLPSYFPSGASKAGVLLLGPFCGAAACHKVSLIELCWQVGLLASFLSCPRATAQSVYVPQPTTRASRMLPSASKCPE